MGLRAVCQGELQGVVPVSRPLMLSCTRLTMFEGQGGVRNGHTICEGTWISMCLVHVGLMSELELEWLAAPLKALCVGSDLTQIKP